MIVAVKYLAALSLFLFLFIGASSFAPASAIKAERKIESRPEQEAWLIEQIHENKSHTYIKVTRDAVALKISPSGCMFLTKAPDWKVHCYRLPEKIEWIGEMAQFSGIVMTNPYATVKPIVRGPKPVLVGQTSVCGLKSQTYRILREEVQCSNEIAVNPRIVLFFNRLYGTPIVPSVPLGIVNNRTGGRLKETKGADWMNIDVAGDLRKGRVRSLTTTSCHKIPYDSKDFETPVGYKRVVDLIQVSYSRDQRSEIDDMLNNVGFESDAEAFNKKKAP